MRGGFFSEAVRDKAFSMDAIRTGKIAADIGEGTGFITEGLIRKSLKVIAIDRSEAMLAKMKEKFSHDEGIDYREGEAENLPISDGTVDYVFANMYLHHVDHLQRLCGGVYALRSSRLFADLSRFPSFIIVISIHASLSLYRAARQRKGPRRDRLGVPTIRLFCRFYIP